MDRVVDGGGAVKSGEGVVTWERWRRIYERAEAGLRPEGYSAQSAREALLRLVPDARAFPVNYVPGRTDQRGLVSELTRPRGWDTTTPGGMAAERGWGRATLVGWVLGDEYEVVDVDDPAVAAAAGITPQRLVDAGAMIVLTPSGGCHAIFLASEGHRRKSRIRSVAGTDWLTGGRYIHAPFSWRPEHTDRGKQKPAGLYLPIWDDWNPVPLDDALYRLVVQDTTGGDVDDVFSGWDPAPGGAGLPQWAQLQDAAVMLKKRNPDLSAQQAAGMLWQRHLDGWLPDENADWPWTRDEFVSRVENGWANRREWERERAQQAQADASGGGYGREERIPDDVYDTEAAAGATDTTGGEVDDVGDSKAWRPYLWADRVRAVLHVETDREQRIYHYDRKRRIHVAEGTEPMVARLVRSLFLDRQSGLPKPAGGPKPSHYSDVITELKTAKPRINMRPMLYGFKNRTLDLSNPLKPVVSKPGPEDCLTHRAAYKYRRKAKCPSYDRFIGEVLPGGGYVYLIDQFIAFAISDRVPPKGALFGEGLKDTGKSTLAEILDFVLAGQTCAVTPQQMGDEEFYLKILEKMKANIVGDVDLDDIGNTAAFKSATSGKREKITANRKHLEMLELVVTCPMFFFGNDRPRSKKDKSDAFRARQIVIPMVRQFGEDEKDEHLNAKLEAEAAGIFNRGLAALQKMLKSGRWQWEVPETARQSAAEDLREIAQHKAWADARIVDDPDGFITNRQCHQDYLDWGETQGWLRRKDKDDRGRGVYLWAQSTLTGKLKTLWGGNPSRKVDGKSERGFPGKRLRVASDGGWSDVEAEAEWEAEQARQRQAELDDDGF